MLCNIEQIKENSIILSSIFEELSFLRSEYPEFYKWFFNKVIPGVENGTRKIFIAKTPYSFGKINGVLILKDTPFEKKICTLYVDKESRFNGVGKKFIDVAFNELKTNKPMMTVADNKIEVFRKLLNKFDFELYEKNPDFYSEGITEYSYNGHLYLPNEINSYA